MANNVNVLNKSLTSCIFSNYGSLLIRPQDLADSMISISISGDSVNRIQGALETVRSPNFYTEVEVSIALLKTTNLASLFINQYKAKSILDGTAIVNTDGGAAFKLTNLSFELSGVSSDGTDATLNISLKGNLQTNSELLI